jgi:hypothetical protein
VLDTPVRRELAHFGIVCIDAPAERFVARFGDIERFERGPGIPQMGRLGVPPRLEDLASLTLPAKDVTALATCRPGDCDLKLSAAAMTRFQNQVNWSSPNAAVQANEVARAMILELVRAYQVNGNAALGRYDDGGESSTRRRAVPRPAHQCGRATCSDAGAHDLSERLPAQAPRRRRGFLLLVGGGFRP